MVCQVFVDWFTLSSYRRFVKSAQFDCAQISTFGVDVARFRQPVNEFLEISDFRAPNLSHPIYDYCERKRFPRTWLLLVLLRGHTQESSVSPNWSTAKTISQVSKKIDSSQ